MTFTNMQIGLREMLDRLAVAWMRWAAAEPGAGPVQAPSVGSPITVPLTCVNSSSPSAPKSTTTPFQPLAPDILNESIPTFFIGRDRDGFWLARDAGGRVGGLFLLQSSALAFARRHAWPSGCATVFSSEVVELDVENQGNPLIEYLRPVMRLLMQGLHRISALASAFFGFVGGRS